MYFSMYANDINPKIQALYAPITFPVSRGTPSIHNLPLWEHSAYFKTQNDDVRLALRLFLNHFYN